jgi:ERCC4-type nuclease
VIIKVDTREQAPITFDVTGSISRVDITGLPFGDYWAEWEPGTEKAGYNCEMPVAFERKSISDLFGTLTGGYERFKRELQRAKENNFKLILIVEGTMSEVLAGTKYSEVKGESIMKTMFTLWMKYDLVPVFCPNRSEMRRYMIETFEAIGRNYKPKKPSAAEGL